MTTSQSLSLGVRSDDERVVVTDLAIVLFKMLSNKGRETLLRACGVSLKKLARSVKEIKRKGFHIAGLLVPLCQLLLLRSGFTAGDCIKICWTITIVGTSMDWLRRRKTKSAAIDANDLTQARAQCHRCICVYQHTDDFAKMCCTGFHGAQRYQAAACAKCCRCACTYCIPIRHPAARAGR